MSDDEYPPEWLDQAPEPDWDVSPFAPKPDQQARAIALFNARVADTPLNYERMLLDYCRDVIRDKTMPSAVWALVEYGLAQHLIAAGHRDDAAARIRMDLSVAREQILNEELQ